MTDSQWNKSGAEAANPAQPAATTNLWSIGIAAQDGGEIPKCVAGLLRAGLAKIRLFIHADTIVPCACAQIPVSVLNEQLSPSAAEHFIIAEMLMRTPAAEVFLLTTSQADPRGLKRWSEQAAAQLASGGRHLILDSEATPLWHALTREAAQAFLSDREGLVRALEPPGKPDRFGAEIIHWGQRAELAITPISRIDSHPSSRQTEPKTEPKSKGGSDASIHVSGARVSIVVPNWNCAAHLPACLDSLLRQTAASEVIVVDDASSDDSQSVLQSFGDRIRVVTHTRQRGANAARNTGIKAATGDFIAFADADNEYVPRWIEHLLHPLLGQPAAALAYCGYTKERGDGSRIENRGAAWDLDTLWFGNYIDMCSLVRRSTLPREGLAEGFRPFDDWRLWLDLADRGWEGVWVPQQLFVKHVRDAGKTQQSWEDPHQRGREIVELRREFAHLVGLEAPVSVVIPACGCEDLTARCLAHLGDYCGVPFHVVYVDNGSPLPALDAVVQSASDAGVSLRIIRNLENRGFTQAVNQGIAASGEANVLVLNNDCFIGPGCVENLARELRFHDRVAAAGPLTGDEGKQSLRNPELRQTLRLPEEILDKLDDPVRMSFRLKHKLHSIAAPVLSFYCALLSGEALRRFGGLDSRFSSGLAADDEWCLRVREQGREVRVVLNAYAAHLHQSSFKRLALDRHLLQQDAQQLLHGVLAEGPNGRKP